MSRRKGSDNFNFSGFKSTNDVSGIKTIKGTDNRGELLRPLPFQRRFRPATGTKDFSVLSDYDYASLWTRWRRGYEMAMYSQQAYDGLAYSFKYYVSGPNGIGAALPGVCFMYPTTRSDMRMWAVGIRPRDSFNFLDYGYAITAVTDYSSDIYAVKLNTRFGAPVSFFAGEILSNRFNADGTEKTSGYNNYTVVGVGRNNTILPPSYIPSFDTLFLSHTDKTSWTVVDANTLAVPATGPPTVGEFLTTEMRTQCTCPDFLARENFNLYEASLRMRYPYTRVQNTDPGFYDAGPEESVRRNNSPDNPGYARSFGFIYLNEIYNTPRFSEVSYSDPNVYYYQPRWCKHIYAAMWDMQLRYNQSDATRPWLPQPSDEPMNEWYREKFEKDLEKQFTFFKRERDLVWWQRYSPTKDNMPQHMTYPDMYNMMSKTLNFGNLSQSGVIEAPNFEMFTLNEFNPFSPTDVERFVTYNGGVYSSGTVVTRPTRTLDGGLYSNGIKIPPSGFPSLINGGVY